MDFWSIVLGSVLTLAGSVVVTILQDRSARERWVLERDEGRLLQAATDIGRARTMIEEFSPMERFNGEADAATRNLGADQWRDVRPDVRTIAFIRRDLADDIDNLSATVVAMLDQNNENLLRALAKQEFDPAPAWASKEQALEIVRRISEKLATTD